MTVSFRYVWIQDAADHWTFRIEPEDWTPPPPEELSLDRLRELVRDVPADAAIRFDGEGGFRVAPPESQPSPADSGSTMPRTPGRSKRGRKRD